jgi:hypothetical protein
VLQRSANGGKTWSRIIPISPGFPGSGADIGPILIEPDGRLDVLYQGYHVLNRKTLKLGVAHDYFTTSTDNGWTWSRPRRLGPRSHFMNTTEWWIDGSLGTGSGKKPDLYATWDTQSGGHDVGWFSYSATGGRTWSPVVRVTPDTDKAVHIVQVLGSQGRSAYVGWLTDSHRCQAWRLRQYSRLPDRPGLGHPDHSRIGQVRELAGLAWRHDRALVAARRHSGQPAPGGELGERARWPERQLRDLGRSGKPATVSRGNLGMA